MKKFLFTIGLVLTIIGYFIGSTDDYPFVLKIVSPAYVNGMIGIKTLESGKDLKEGMVGFKEIAIPLSKRLKVHGTGEEMNDCVIAIIKWPTSVEEQFRTSGVQTVRKVKAECKDGTPIDTTMESLTKNVEKLKARNLRRYSLAIFLIGIICSFISFFVENKKQA